MLYFKLIRFIWYCGEICAVFSQSWYTFTFTFAYHIQIFQRGYNRLCLYSFRFFNNFSVKLIGYVCVFSAWPIDHAFVRLKKEKMALHLFKNITPFSHLSPSLFKIVQNVQNRFHIIAQHRMCVRVSVCAVNFNGSTSFWSFVIIYQNHIKCVIWFGDHLFSNL